QPRRACHAAVGPALMPTGSDPSQITQTMQDRTLPERADVDQAVGPGRSRREIQPCRVPRQVKSECPARSAFVLVDSRALVARRAANADRYGAPCFGRHGVLAADSQLGKT